MAEHTDAPSSAPPPSPPSPPVEAQLDAHLLSYLRAYQDLLTTQVELQALTRDGHLSLASARRELSRTRNTSSSLVSAAQYPAECTASLCVRTDATEEGARSVAVVRRRGGEAEARPAAPPEPKDTAMACGDRLVMEGVGTLTVRSHISSASGGLAAVNASIYQASVSAPDGKLKSDAAPRGAELDPLRWFGALPPQSLRKAQKLFTRAAEAAVQIANAQLRMEHHRALYEELCRSSGREHLLHS
ncbi:hypothetical protein AB1Y20_012371 [Prymnesium parvum]|uniref:Vacuolar ATPase assembly protein VMA22 n=1 Tax=Prymnesium parvum TaxID=97485 RepID=A0AB34IPH9_PRYPA